ncbi:hypothetical protein BEWA_010840 [Theileria equi strain WA]|uniref:Uncharacterized protein n=1 Tax=Theileria equi strain WA TaxID=1537102 RepID=L0B1C0_THEEQ|nr:hypothetical protein BEWA_010840 [Theileria equi strain WA]AFZ81667.1 hypothetical protein BEWA_010840 [Theileria equi strain WA]|eukprot:XP_004831333.1 hypothetical protein BEWA_010840 [Theileria equi strain WA]
MGWDLVSGLIGGTSKDNTTSSCDDKVPPPPSGAFAPPPVPPRGLGSNVSKNPRDLTFNGFTPPPKATVDTSYDASDYSSYTFSDNYNSYTKKEGLVDRIVKNPRAHNCLESIKMGFKMGGAVGGIFGGITDWRYGELRFLFRMWNDSKMLDNVVKS